MGHISDVLSELKLAGRRLIKRPWYAVLATFTLALGIGASVAIFTVVNSVLLRPLSFPGANRIVSIQHHAPGLNQANVESSPGLIEHYRQSARALAGIAGYDLRESNLTAGERPERVRAIAVTPTFFDVMAARPEFGRPFYASDAQQDAQRVVIMTHSFWRSRFGSNPAVVGRQIEVDGRQVEVVGIMPSGFVFPDPRTSLLLPLWLDPQGGFGAFGTRALARLAAGVTLESAQRELDELQGRIPERFPGVTPEFLERVGWSGTMQTLRDDMVGDLSKPLWILLGSVGIVLVIAGSNVANLMLVRAESRHREVAIRSALGANRRQIAATFLAESLLISFSAGVAGTLVAVAGTRLLVAYGPTALPRLHEVSVDGAVVAFASVLSLLTGLALGVLAMSRLRRRSIAYLVRADRHGSTFAGDRHHVRQLLSVGQVAMALVLLVGSGLLLRSVERLYAVQVRDSRVVVFSLRGEPG